VRDKKDAARPPQISAGGKAGSRNQDVGAPGPESSAVPPTNVLVLRGGKVYFEGAADELLHSSDDYLKEFLASAE
jgi:hypothetical protein